MLIGGVGAVIAFGPPDDAADALFRKKPGVAGTMLDGFDIRPD